MTDTPALKLGFGFEFQDLYETEGLERLDAAFVAQLESASPKLADILRSARSGAEQLAPRTRSELLVEMAPLVEDFIGELFGIQPELLALRMSHEQFEPLYNVKRKFVQKRAITRIKADQALAIDGESVAAELEKSLGELSEDSYAAHVHQWLE